jgi:outer membrane protein assembly factor BamD
MTSCSSTRPVGKTEAEVLLKEARELVEDSRFILATERLNTLRSQYPYSYFATHAELLQADILFQQENYVEAAAAYILFKDFHPKFKDIDYVVFKVAESFYNQIPSTFDRDLSPAVEAIKYYKELLRTFKSSKYVKGSLEKITLSEDRLEKKEQYIADFYFKTEVYDAARYRYLDIIKNFRKPKRLLDHSMIRVLEASRLLDKKDECIAYYKKFSSAISTSAKVDLDRSMSACK